MYESMNEIKHNNYFSEIEERSKKSIRRITSVANFFLNCPLVFFSALLFVCGDLLLFCSYLFWSIVVYRLLNWLILFWVIQKSGSFFFVFLIETALFFFHQITGWSIAVSFYFYTISSIALFFFDLILQISIGNVQKKIVPNDSTNSINDHFG